ncbi:MAG: tetratricopeptide repeat protein, partial [Nanoarchaeota archaeon]
IFHFQWSNDFSAARNFALQHTTGDWILVLDADECIAAEDHQRIKELVTQEKSAAYFLHQKEYTNNTTLTGFYYNGAKNNTERENKGNTDNYLGYVLVENAIRLFKNTKNIRFSWRIHESVQPFLEKQGLVPSDSGVFIHHYKQEKGEQAQHEKMLRYLAIEEEQIRETPDNPKPYYEVGLIYHALGKYQDAITAFERVIALQPNERRAYHKLGRSLVKIGDYAKALVVFKKYLTSDETNSDVYGEIGLLFIKRKEYDHAINALTAALQRNSGNILARHNLVLLYLQRGKKENALMLLDEGIKKYTNQYSFNSLGILALQEKDYGKAKKYFVDGIALAPHSSHESTVSLYFNLIKASILEKDKETAVYYLSQLQRFYKGDVLALERDVRAL